MGGSMSEDTMQAFGRACAEQNSVEELLDGLEQGPDGEYCYFLNEASFADCIDWDLTPLEWVRGLNLALLYKLASPASTWEDAETTARSLRNWGIAVETKEDQNGLFHFTVIRGRKTLEKITQCVPRVHYSDSQV
jgi:hypothetical protein